MAFLKLTSEIDQQPFVIPNLSPVSTPNSSRKSSDAGLGANIFPRAKNFDGIVNNASGRRRTSLPLL
ncbi:Spo24p SCDLUD_001310 [Saccharomycodes ludwigii]|uniref:Spo24p n=1 Tax=Saccharomycodes ludwigii TaxID=36035 RepID=UPI001E8462D9|nr:hypothetical protein SCDLUD_001310 [Saccharomycodes ludwigii]KAH3903662.1 hypothetical protein SCDLUD_001310 [Saccharomycodes ludwigii]